LPERVAVLEPAREAAAVLRVGSAMPQVEVVDLRAELKAGNRTIFSRALSSAVAEALGREEQVILFLNRRGASTFVMCRDCGLVLRCRRCDASLVYHSAEDDLVCHLCNSRVPTPDRCPKCLSTRVRYFGVGTQKVEDEARLAFPGARVIRWDRDVVRTRRDHEGALRRFQAHEADILVGTQMIAKGLDLPLVTVVGVVSADTALHLPDFRAVERTFQLLTQVAGRSGRGARAGRAFVQTYTPEHYCIQAASRHDYEAFAAEELRFRREQGYPPYGRLVRLLYAQPGPARVQREAGEMAHRLRGQAERLGLSGVTVLGPAPAYRQRMRGRYRWQVIVRGPSEAVSALVADVDLPVGWAIDVDPVTLL
jgi:primosomal protein N' (replication factor Y)